MNDKILAVRGLSRIHGAGCPLCIASTGPDHDTNICAHCGSVVAAHDVNFDLHRGEILGIIGESGSGKSSTVKMLYFDDMPTTGSATFFDAGERHDLFELNAAQQRGMRNKRFGMVYQNPHLGSELPDFRRRQHCRAAADERSQALRRNSPPFR